MNGNRVAVRLRFDAQDECALEHVEVAPAAAQEIVVENRYSLISAGTELAMLRGRHRGFSNPTDSTRRIQYPFTPGYCAAGEVVQAGPDVTGLVPGDLVWHPGCHQSLAAVPVPTCLKFPVSTPLEDAVFYGMVRVAMTAVRRAPTELGQTVLVAGLGIVGHLAAQLYQLAGGSVLAADRSPGRLERARRSGITVLDLAEHDLTAWCESTGGDRPELVVEATGAAPVIDACLKTVAPGGRVVLLGSPREELAIDPYSDIHAPGVTVVGAHARSVDTATRKSDEPRILRLMTEQRLDFAALRSHVLPVEHAPAAYDGLDTRPDEYLGVLLTYSS